MSLSRNSSKGLSALEVCILAQPVSNIRSLACSSLASSASSSAFFLRVSKPLRCFRSSRNLMEVVDWRVCGRMLAGEDMVGSNLDVKVIPWLSFVRIGRRNLIFCNLDRLNTKMQTRRNPPFGAYSQIYIELIATKSATLDINWRKRSRTRKCNLQKRNPIVQEEGGNLK